MRSITLFLLVAELLPTTAGDDAVPKVATPDGAWVIESIVRDPREKNEGEGKGLKVVVKGERVAIKTPDGKEIGRLIVRLDATRKPKTIDLWAAEPASGKPIEEIQKEPAVLGIYESDRDTLRVCWSRLEDRARPDRFASDFGSGRSLVVLRREKPPVAEPKQADWVEDASRAAIPARPAEGRIHGRGFVVDTARLSPYHQFSGSAGDPPAKQDRADGGVLTLQRGEDRVPVDYYTIFLAVKPGEVLDGKTFLVPPGGLFHQPGKVMDRDGKGWFYAVSGVHANSREPGKEPRSDLFSRLTMRLVFGKREGGRLPGRIYLCIDDAEKTFVAGCFEARITGDEQGK